MTKRTRMEPLTPKRLQQISQDGKRSITNKTVHIEEVAA